MLECRRQDQRLTQVLAVLVDREAGPHRRDLEQHPARLPEVDRAEPEPVDDPARMRSGGADARQPVLLLVHVRGPCDAMYGARTGDAGPRRRRRIKRVATAAHGAARLPRALARRDEAERLLEERAARLGSARERADAVE